MPSPQSHRAPSIMLARAEQSWAVEVKIKDTCILGRNAHLQLGNEVLGMVTLLSGPRPCRLCHCAWLSVQHPDLYSTAYFVLLEELSLHRAVQIRYVGDFGKAGGR